MALAPFISTVSFYVGTGVRAPQEFVGLERFQDRLARVRIEVPEPLDLSFVRWRPGISWYSARMRWSQSVIVSSRLIAATEFMPTRPDRTAPPGVQSLTELMSLDPILQLGATCSNSSQSVGNRSAPRQ